MLIAGEHTTCAQCDSITIPQGGSLVCVNCCLDQRRVTHLREHGPGPSRIFCGADRFSLTAVATPTCRICREEKKRRKDQQ